MARQQAQESGVAASTQVSARGTRRRFTADYKASIVQQVAQCRAFRALIRLTRPVRMLASPYAESLLSPIDAAEADRCLRERFIGEVSSAAGGSCSMCCSRLTAGC